MKKQIKYTNEPIEAKVIEDFLPSPENLALQDSKKKITITLTSSSLEFFKSEARKYNSSYQAMIRKLLDHYVSSHTVK